MMELGLEQEVASPSIGLPTEVFIILIVFVLALCAVLNCYVEGRREENFEKDKSK